MEKETGGQAFPCLDDAGSGLSLRDGGMTLRDYFAAKAMQGLIEEFGWDISRLVKKAYEIADAMLEARK
jgi:hypothetical protein